jgi:hypothetical protein
VLTAACVSGCAGVHFKTIPSYPNATAAQTADTKADGIRYYEQAPFLLVYTDGKGGLKTQFLYLPDTSRKKVLDPYAWLANNNITLSFNKGMLTGNKIVVDETVVPKAVIEVAKIALIASFDAGKGPPGDEIPPPALYRIWVNTDGSVELIGGYGLDVDGNGRQNIRITVSQPPEKSTAATAK